MKIVGHASQRESLKRLLLEDRLPATLLFSGQAGTGKRLVALELCRTLVCERGRTPQGYGGCGKCRNCILFDAGNYPDLHVVQCLDKENWNVEAIRSLLFSINLAAFCGGVRLVVFDNVEHMGVQSANALLKSLEEPRPNTYYILITASPSRLPQTLISRCQVWFFDALTREEVEQVLSLPDFPGAAALREIPRQELLTLADGSLAGLAEVAPKYDDWLNLRRSLDEIFAGAVPAAVTLAQELGKKKEELRIKLHLLRIHARDRMKDEPDPQRKARWAVFLANTIAADRLIFDRNLSAATVLTVALNALASGDAHAADEMALLDRITV